MFKEWLHLFQKDSLMDRAYRLTSLMLDITLSMFLKVKTLLRHTDSVQVDIDIIDIYGRDAEVNRYQREVRRHVFKHLTMRGVERLPSGLVLISIVINIERIGDYTKNILELAVNHPRRLHGQKFETDLQRVETAVEDNFISTKNCFESADEKTAHQLLKEYEWVSRLCDDCLFRLIKEDDKNIGSGDAVSLALYFRWLKRINSHLRNISSSIVNPFDWIGFKPGRD